MSATPPAAARHRRLQRSKDEKCDEYVSLAMQQISGVSGLCT